MIGYVLAGAAIGAYLHSVVAKDPRIFDWANVILFAPMAWANYTAGAPFASVLSVFFGLIGIVGVARAR